MLKFIPLNAIMLFFALMVIIFLLQGLIYRKRPTTLFFKATKQMVDLC